MKLSKFWWVSTITGALLLFFLACHTQKDMQPDKSITQNLHLFDFYPEAATDYEVETIAHHYMTGEDDPDAYGHILVDFDNVEVPIYVYSGRKKGLYWYKLDTETGAERAIKLTPEQRKHVWSFN